jgi:hypothetical protein
MGLYYVGHPREEYFEGECASLAIALSEITGKPVAALVEHDEVLKATVLIHAFVQLDDANILDAVGFSTVETVEAEFPHTGNPEVLRLPADELLRMAYGEIPPPNQHDVTEVAQALIAECWDESPDECIEHGIARPAASRKCGP